MFSIIVVFDVRRVEMSVDILWLNVSMAFFLRVTIVLFDVGRVSRKAGFFGFADSLIAYWRASFSRRKFRGGS